MIWQAVCVSRKPSREAKKVNPFSSDWFFQSIQQYLTDYLCPSFREKKERKKKKIRITVEKKGHSWCGIIHDANTKESDVQSEPQVDL